MNDAKLSTDQLGAALDNAPIAVYVSALDTFELLYANELARKLMLRLPGKPGGTCYQAAGFAAPCPFCRVHSMSKEAFSVREFAHPADGRTYQLSGKIIDWEGVPAHIEYILDITDRKREEDRNRALKDQLENTFSSIPCGLCVYRFDGTHIAPVIHNPAFFAIMGYSADHIRSLEEKTEFLGVHPADLAELQRKIAQAIRENGQMYHVYRVFNDRLGEYRFIRLDGAVKPQPDGSKLLYGVYSDVSEQQRLERELAEANEKMRDIVNAIPGGVAIYKVSDIFETVYFSDGVPELSGYTVEEYHELIRGDAARMTYAEDTPMVVGRLREAIARRETADFEFRKQHRDGHLVWVRVQAKQIGEEDGYPLLHCVFYNISALKETQLEMDHLINSIPGGIASYKIERGNLVPVLISDGVMALSGHTREELERTAGGDTLRLIYEPDRERVRVAAETAIATGTVLDIFYRIRHKNGKLIWVHLNGRRMGPYSEHMRFYAVFTGMSAEARLYQSIANETVDGLYVIDRRNYDLLYANESDLLFMKQANPVGQKCYAALHGKSEPCEFCTLGDHLPDGEEHEMAVPGTDRFFSTRFKETDWNGIPAYVKYVRDVTDEVVTRREKERLEQYFETVVKNLPGGVAVVRYERDGRLTPEFLSDGFAAMTGMTLDEAWELYRRDAMAGVHPEDCAHVRAQMGDYVLDGAGHCEIEYRLRRGRDGYVWVKNTLTMIRNEGGECRVYAVYHDMTKERQEKERIRSQYRDLLLQHYNTADPNELIVGHCDITSSRILEIIDRTHSALLETFGWERDGFFTGIAGLIVDEEERNAFLATYLNAPARAAFERGDTEQILKCYIRLPQEKKGRYVQFKVNLVKEPDTGDLTGILTVTDVTEQTISDRILHQLSVTNYDFVVDLDLEEDRYTVLTRNKTSHDIPAWGCHSARLDTMAERVVPRDRERYRDALQPDTIRRRLREEGAYTFAFSVADERGDIRTKNMTVSAVDLRLGRICLVRTDITDSVREQQGLLNVIAYTFDLLGLVDVASGRLTMHTRQTVLENLPPFGSDDYESSIRCFAEFYGSEEDREEALRQFRLETMVRRLAEQPKGYDFVFPYRAPEGLRYKQINVLWGDENRRTICLVRADVTDMLAAEREAKRTLENTLALAEEANRAKSEFLSNMSHDIRTPMNAIMGMTTLAVAHLGDRERVADCLQKISVSSKHLLSLINDVLDMSKIERAKITLNPTALSLEELAEQLTAMMAPQARTAGVDFRLEQRNIRCDRFYGDRLRINQIFINILSNALKFTPEGGRVEATVEQIPAVGDLSDEPAEQLSVVGNSGDEPAEQPTAERPERVRFRFIVRDTGIGMSEELLAHVFEPFTRSRGAAQVEGTGLGLSITKGLVDLMEGTLTVESKEREGTTFRVELEFDVAPAEALRPSRRAPSQAEQNALPLAGRRFLIAEDNALNAEILVELLRMNGAESVVRPDGAQAVQAFLDAPAGTYDAVLMDIQMPVLNGYEATRAIREAERPDGRGIPIVAMTANAFAEDVQAALAAGMDAHVAKPIDLDVLCETLRRVLS